MKKIISMILVLCMVLGMSVSVFAEGATLVATADALVEALEAGEDVLMTGDIEMEAATTAPYGNKYGIKLDRAVLDGGNYELFVECYGDDYGIMTSGGTIKNLTVKEGCRAIMIMSPTEDIIIDNVKIGGDGVLYPINTGEKGSDGVKLVVTNSMLAGWTSFSNIESASFTNVTFKQGTYYNDIYGRVVKPYVNTTFTDCSFIEHMNLDLSALQEGHKVTFANRTVNGTPVTADVFKVPANNAEYDTLLFSVDMPSWADSLEDCVECSYVAPDPEPTPDTDDSYYEEPEEDTHTSSSDMNELIEESSKNDTSVAIDDVCEETTISQKAMENAVEEGLDIEFNGDSYTLTLKAENADFSEFKGTFSPYIDTDANATTSMKSELKKNDIDPTNVQVIKTEYSGQLPGEMELEFTLDKELRGAKVYFYYWNPELKQYEEIPCTVKGNKVIVTLSHFSTYIVTSEPIEGAVVKAGAVVTAPIASADKANPDTGASDFAGVAMALAVVSSMGAVALRKHK